MVDIKKYIGKFGTFPQGKLDEIGEVLNKSKNIPGKLEYFIKELQATGKLDVTYNKTTKKYDVRNRDTIGPDNGVHTPIELYYPAVDSKYDKLTQEILMSLTICWYESETEKEEEKVLSRLREFRRYLDSDTGKVLVGAHKVTDGIDEFINEATMAIMASGIKLPAEWSELSLEQRIVAETREIKLLNSRYLKINLQLFAEKEAGAKELALKGSYSTPYTQRLQASYQNFQNVNIDITEHGLNRVLGRASRGVTVENTINTYKTGKLYYDPQENTYIRFKNRIAVSYDVNSGKIVNVQTQNKPTGRWKEK